MIEAMKQIGLFFLVALLIVGCTASHKGKPFTIGRDPTWFPLQLDQLALNVTAFSTALTQDIARTAKVPIDIINIDWYQLLEGLQKKTYDGIFSSLDPNDITRGQYDFSEPFLSLGPVLVVRSTSSATSLNDLRGGIVGVNQFDNSVLIVQKNPTIIIRPYERMAMALTDLVDGALDGVVLSTLEAHILVPTQFSQSLKIVTPPLSDQGLRLLTLKGQNELLIERFNKGLAKARKKGVYDELMQHFGLPR